jgi:hypothetical protein
MGYAFRLFIANPKAHARSIATSRAGGSGDKSPHAKDGAARRPYREAGWTRILRRGVEGLKGRKGEKWRLYGIWTVQPRVDLARRSRNRMDACFQRRGRKGFRRGAQRVDLCEDLRAACVKTGPSPSNVEKVCWKCAILRHCSAKSACPRIIANGALEHPDPLPLGEGTAVGRSKISGRVTRRGSRRFFTGTASRAYPATLPLKAHSPRGSRGSFGSAEGIETEDARRWCSEVQFVTRVPTFSPSTTRRMLLGLNRSKTMMGILLSMQSEKAVESITFNCRCSAS